MSLLPISYPRASPARGTRAFYFSASAHITRDLLAASPLDKGLLELSGNHACSMLNTVILR